MRKEGWRPFGAFLAVMRSAFTVDGETAPPAPTGIYLTKEDEGKILLESSGALLLES